MTYRITYSRPANPKREFKAEEYAETANKAYEHFLTVHGSDLLIREVEQLREGK